MNRSDLNATLKQIAELSADAVTDYLRSNNSALNRHTRKCLSAPPGRSDSLIADPIIEVAQDWLPAQKNFGEYGGGLLDPSLVEALDSAKAERMPRERKPYAHQVAAWEASAKGESVLVSSGTGSGKTECFMIPILNDILQNPGPEGGVRAIIVYPLNALIESQRERLSAWAAGLGGKVTYALFNRNTPEKNKTGDKGEIGELLDRKSIRSKPPTILVTNVTMLEYMLLRSEDQSILQKSQGLLRWIVLDEAHSYIGAQASEMAMLLRRVRAAFGVTPEQVRLMATSATIEDDTGTRLSEFMQGLSGRDATGITVIEGMATEAPLPTAGKDVPIVPSELTALAGDQERWQALAPHPRVQSLRSQLKSGMTLGQISLHCFGRSEAAEEAELVLDTLAQAAKAPGEAPLLRWRGHLFQRSLGGACACLDPACPHKSAELRDAPEWAFGQVHFSLRERCTCGAPVMEVEICNHCGTPHLKARQEFGRTHRLIPPLTENEDDFATDVEPDPDAPDEASAQDDLWVTSKAGKGRLCYLDRDTLELLSIPPDDTANLLELRVIDGQPICDCDETRSDSRFKSFRFGPAFLAGSNMQTLIEAFSLPDPEPGGKPLHGRGAISFTDSRQGVARLAAKLQAEAERNLTRAFLFHVTHQVNSGGSDTSGEKIAQLESAIAQMESVGVAVPSALFDQLETLRAAKQAPAGIAWKTAVNDLACQPEVGLHLKKLWEDLDRDFANDDNVALARILLYREMMRRPVRQNGAETMGLARLAFPALEAAILKQPLPSALLGRGVGNEDYLGLVLSAIDFFFRERLIVALEERQHIRWIAPKWGVLHSACNNDVPKADRNDSLAFPSAKVKGEQRMNRIAVNALALTGGSRKNDADLEEADILLREVFSQITTHAGKSLGPNAWALDFSKAEIRPIETGWFCPVTRRVFGYSIKGCSPVALERPMERIEFPKPPITSPGGVSGAQRAELQSWLESEPALTSLREKGIWTDLHDRTVLYPRYMRAQEHSAQMKRAQLSDYEDQFNAGYINLLSCSTTMEMGVDLANVGLVVNTNVPPSVSNYRQRVGRAGRRREPWAFALTLCRALPLDQKVFEDPRLLLYARMTAPKVALNSRILIERHVNAATLANWLRGQVGIRISDKIGPFFGMDLDGKVLPDAPVDRFLNALARGDETVLLPDAAVLLRGSCLEGRPTEELLRDVATAMGNLVARWRNEFEELLRRSQGSGEKDVSIALENRALNMHGSFLFSELATSGFTPAYGFPTDVVSFEYVGPGGERRPGNETARFAKRTNGNEKDIAPTRPLDVALREYAPGSDIVINSLVYTSEGIRPAWSANASASNLEDLRQLYSCPDCGKPHLLRALPETCSCGAAVQISYAQKTLRPVGFAGRKKPHIGYELLQTSKFSMPTISAEPESWLTVSDEGWRLRATPSGQVITLASGYNEAGYAICLLCGRAAHEEAPGPGPLPTQLSWHDPLVTGPLETLSSGKCIGGIDGMNIQRHVHLVHDRHTDVFELQLPLGSTQSQGFGLAAALRESLAAWLGVEPAELGIAVGPSKGADLSKRFSAFIFDKAAGGAGRSTRLAETGQLAARLTDAIAALDCPEHCVHGCPSCILRPDMNMSQVQPDREGALELARHLRNLLSLDTLKQVFGERSSAVGKPLFDLINREINQKNALSVTIFVQGKATDWDIDEWAVRPALNAWHLQLPVTLVFATDAIQNPSLDPPSRLQLVGLTGAKDVAHMAQLPQQRGVPVLAMIETANGVRGLAAMNPAETLPNENWGRGASGTLVSGPLEALPEWHTMPAIDFMPRTEAGKSFDAPLDKRFNAPLPRFGKTFWAALRADGPAIIERLESEGVKELHYNDRYLLKPIQFGLLKQIVEATPGRSEQTALRVTTMLQNDDKYSAPPRDLDWNLCRDDDREELFYELFPSDKLSILSKPQTKHQRNLTIETIAGNKVIIWLDQGMDLWKLATRAPISSPRDPLKIARDIENCAAFVSLRDTDSPPLFIKLIPASESPSK